MEVSFKMWSRNGEVCTCGTLRTLRPTSAIDRVGWLYYLSCHRSQTRITGQRCLPYREHQQKNPSKEAKLDAPLTSRLAPPSRASKVCVEIRRGPNSRCFRISRRKTIDKIGQHTARAVPCLALVVTPLCMHAHAP